MTSEKKLLELKTAIAPDTESDEVLSSLLGAAESLILNKMYPFGYPENMVTPAVPVRYERLQIQLAVELYTKRGAEGQISHSENGISRSWSEKSALLAQIVPHVGGVMSNA